MYVGFLIEFMLLIYGSVYCENLRNWGMLNKLPLHNKNKSQQGKLTSGHSLTNGIVLAMF